MLGEVAPEPGSGVEAAPAGADGVFGDGWPRAQQFAQLLAAEGELRGLIGPRELPRLWTRHLLNSSAVLSGVPRETEHFADVGSGAGFPGVLVAIIRPELRVHLIEPMERRVDWLNYVVRELALPRVRVHRARAEELIDDEMFDVVSARAVAHLRKLIPWTMPLVRAGGRLVALKGERAADEVTDAKAVLRKHGARNVWVDEVSVLGSDQPARLVIAQRR